MEKKSFIVHEKWISMFLDAPAEDVGSIFKAMMRYTTTGDIGDVQPMHRAILSMMIEAYEDDTEKYNAVCEKRKKAVEKRWADYHSKQEHTDEYTGIQMNTNVYTNIQTDTDKDKDKDKDKVLDMDMVLDKDKGIKREDAIASKREMLSRIADAWNCYPNRGRIPKVQKLNPTRECGKRILERVKEFGMDEVLRCMDEVFKSPFLRGEKSEWKATFDWFSRPNNFPKVLEGNYRDETQKKSSSEEQADFLSAWINKREAT